MTGVKSFVKDIKRHASVAEYLLQLIRLRGLGESLNMTKVKSVDEELRQRLWNGVCSCRFVILSPTFL